MGTRLAMLMAAPHRLLFLVGVTNVTLLMAWWLIALVALYWLPIDFPGGVLPAGLEHGPVMIFIMFAPFMFGFLLTVFPRWMGYPDLQARHYGPVAILIATGAGLVLAGLFAGSNRLFATGLVAFAAGWLAGIAQMVRILRLAHGEGKETCWHGWSALAGMSFGFAGLICLVMFVASFDTMWHDLSVRIGLYGFLIPIFCTVAHRMVPFFAGNVVENYVRWRPLWILAALWAALMARLAVLIVPLPNLDAPTALILCFLTGLMLWRWWPRGRVPGLMLVLLWGLAWAPIGFGLMALSALVIPLGRGPNHALAIGFAGSLMIAMGTRVTQGHSGQPLTMPRVAWIAFCAIQIATILRISAAVLEEQGDLLMLAALSWLILMLPWCTRNAYIYCVRRRDGRAG